MTQPMTENISLRQNYHEGCETLIGKTHVVLTESDERPVVSPYEELFRTWERGGRVNFAKRCYSQVDLIDDEPNHDTTEELALEFVNSIHNLFSEVIKGRIRRDSAVAFAHEIVNYNVTAADLLADAISNLDVETRARAGSSRLRERIIFVDVLKKIQGTLRSVLLERLDMESIKEAVYFGNPKTFSNRFVKLKTKIYYKQSKYNLFREECEGYAKFLGEITVPVTNRTPVNLLAMTQCFIGRFSLDPNRVMDLLLEAFEVQPNCGFFVPALQKVSPNPSERICEILGFKLISQSESPPPTSMYNLISLLLQHKVIRANEIYPWLSPNDVAIRRVWDHKLKGASEYARKSMIVRVNKESSPREVDEIDIHEDRFDDNQKLMVLESLFENGAWEVGREIMKKLPEYSCVSNKRLALCIARLVHYLINPVYTTITGYKSRISGEGRFDRTRNNLIPPQAKTYNDLNKVIDVILILGPYIHFDHVLFCKLVRIMRTFMRSRYKDREKTLYTNFITILDEVILPGLCFMDSNCCVAEDIWSILRHYPYQFRYRLYGSWKGEAILHLHPTLLTRRVDLVKKIKHLLKRLSKENVKPMGRLIGKLSHAMPGVIFEYILTQIQLFDNLITPVIDSLKYLTGLSYDVLCYCILEALSPSSITTQSTHSIMLTASRSRTKHDGSTIAPWIQSLSSFTGAICKKYAVELVPILQYIANQLKCKQSLDLLLLKEIVHKMTGIEAAEDLTVEQLSAMSGGEVLRSEAGYFGQVRTSKKSGSRLKDAVSVHDLAVTLCILMAQQRNCIVFDEGSTLHTKLIGKLYDQCQDTLVQFGTFLATSFTLDDYSNKIPPLKSLIEEYHVSADVAFFLWRPLFSNEITTKYDELRRAEKSHKNLSTTQRIDKYIQAANMILNPIEEMMVKHLPVKTWEDISPQFYITFWSLKLSDLYVPSDSYAREIQKVKQAYSAATDNRDMASSKRRKEQERCITLIERLQEEERRQKEHVDRVMAKLRAEKDTWFASRIAKSAKNEAVTAFLQLCLFPRCIFTAPDALYSAHFVKIIHALSTPNFSTLICYDRIFCDVIYCLTSCTENEANRYGRFLCSLLETVMKWHGDPNVFNKECSSYPGFITKFRTANTIAAHDGIDHVDYENYRHVCHKWHYKITKCIIVCLESKDFTQIRNALIVLMRVLPYFPKVSNLATAVERWVERVRSEQKDTRQDLFALATSYIGQLKTRWSNIITEEEFHDKSIPATTTPPSQPQPSQPTLETRVYELPKVPKPIENPKAPTSIENQKVPKPIESPKVSKSVESVKVSKAVESVKVSKAVESVKVSKPVESAKVLKQVESTSVPKQVDSAKVSKPAESTIASKQPGSGSIDRKRERRDSYPESKRRKTNDKVLKDPKPIENPKVPIPVESSKIPKPVVSSKVSKPPGRGSGNSDRKRERGDSHTESKRRKTNDKDKEKDKKKRVKHGNNHVTETKN